MNRSLIFSLLIALFGVCSVSPAHAYPVSKVTPWSSGSYEQEVKVTRAARDTQVQAPQTSTTTTKEYRTPLSPGTHNLSLGVGEVFLAGKLSDSYENALGTQVQYTYGVSDLFSFESNFGYSSHSTGNLSMVHLLTGVRTNLIYFDQLVPFFSGGLGFYHPSLTLPNNSTVSALLFGLNIGAGADLLLSDRIFFGTRLTFHDMFDSTKTASDGRAVVVGGSFISFLVHAGVSF